MNAHYPAAARAYWQAGWRGLLPLPPGRKHPPPPGTTGRDAPDPAPGQLSAWCRRYPRGGLALRLPADIIGIDVDAYKAAGWLSWQQLTRECGLPPRTWCSTSRDDGSGIRLYRVPTGLSWDERRAGDGIELIRREHRYCVVWPSLHPEGRPYRWITPTGDVAPDATVPRVGQLSALPAAWIDRLTLRPTRQPASVPPVSRAPARGYPAALLSGICGDLGTLTSGRNNGLYMGALRLGRLVADGRLSEAEVTDALVEAAERNGYVGRRGLRAAHKTIDSGLRAGRTSPAPPGGGRRG